MSINELKERYDKIVLGETIFSGALEDIENKYYDILADVYEKDNNIVKQFKVAFDVFFYEYIWRHEQDEFVIDGMMLCMKRCIQAIYFEHDDIDEVSELEEEVFERIKLYRDKFEYPQYDDDYAGKSLFEEVMALDDSNEYKLKLWYALLYPLYEGEDLNDFEKQQMIDDVLVYYDFEYKIPQLRQQLSEENERITNHIPKFDNVKIGDTWIGGRREANFIRALCLKPYKAGSNWRKAQIKSIKRSCRWEDDGNEIILLEIYPERLDKETTLRTGKYETEFKNVLLYHINRLDGVFKTSIGKGFVNTYTISQNYKKVKISEYIERLEIEDNKIEEITEVFNEYHDITDKRLKEILKNAFKYLEKKKYITTKKQLIIVKDKKYIPLEDVKEIDLSVIEVEEMIEEANQYALKKLQEKYNGLELITMSNIMGSYRYNEFKSIYDKYIQENYGWDYTFEQIVIYRNEKLEDEEIEYNDYVKSKQALNMLLIDAVRNTMVTKYNNLLKKHLEEEKKNEELLSFDSRIEEYIELGIIDKDGVIKNNQFKYPESFIEYIDYYIDKELKI